MKITFTGWKNHSTKSFTYLTLVPTLDFVIDKQMIESFYGSDGKKYGGYLEYSLGFLWLKFALYINVEVYK